MKKTKKWGHHQHGPSWSSSLPRYKSTWRSSNSPTKLVPMQSCSDAHASCLLLFLGCWMEHKPGPGHDMVRHVQYLDQTWSPSLIAVQKLWCSPESSCGLGIDKTQVSSNIKQPSQISIRWACSSTLPQQNVNMSVKTKYDTYGYGSKPRYPCDP